jgi:hypothetical protein
VGRNGGEPSMGPLDGALGRWVMKGVNSVNEPLFQYILLAKQSHTTYLNSKGGLSQRMDFLKG